MSTEHSMESADHPMAFLLEQEFSLRIPKPGETCTGYIVSNSGKQILVDIGAKSEGLIDPREVEQMSHEDRSQLTEGEEVCVYIVDSEDSHGNILVSIEQAIAENDWQEAKNMLETEIQVECQIIGHNKGGLLTELGALRAFIPASQLGIPPHELRSEKALAQFVGQTLVTKVIEVDRSRNRLILSAKEAALHLRQTLRRKKLTQYEEGQIVNGNVVNIEKFGIFVDIGGIQGLVHLSELSWQRVNDPKALYSVGDKVDVYILNIDNDKSRIALSVKRLKEDPWVTINSHYKEGDFVPATITKLEKYGAFARLQGDLPLEGLIHISELSEEKVKNPQEVVKLRESVVVKIIKINQKEKQLGLSIKHVPQENHLISEPEDVEELSPNETLTASA